MNTRVSEAWAKLFGKRFELRKSEYGKFFEEKVEVEYSQAFLQRFFHQIEELKDELNYTKSRLNDFDIQIWRTHTNFMNLCGNLSRYCKKALKAELCTQAWLKFCTILNTFKLINTKANPLEEAFTSIHLCEAPGAFVTCLNHHIVEKYPNLRWNWMATTFNPYYEGNNTNEMIADDRFIKNTLKNWYFGEDFTGDIMNLKNMDHFKGICQRYPCVDLVTADGSIDCSESPEMQETLVAQLLYWEFITALNIMTRGSNFVMKAFTVLEEFTISLVYLLSTAFRQVQFFKPGPSKPGNSEVYIVCTAFHGLDALGKKFLDVAMQRTNCSDFKTSLVPFQKIPEQFLTSLLECQEFFIRHQIEAIISNIDSFEKLHGKKRKHVNELKEATCKYFVEHFHLRPLQKEECLTYVEGDAKSRLPTAYTKEHLHNYSRGTLYERIEKKKSSWYERAAFEAPTDFIEDDSPKIYWFSSTKQKITANEVYSWSPIIGKKFTEIRSTQFGSNYLMKDLFEAREWTKGSCLRSSCNDTFEKAHYATDIERALANDNHAKFAVIRTSEEKQKVIDFEHFESLMLALDALFNRISEKSMNEDHDTTMTDIAKEKTPETSAIDRCTEKDVSRLILTKALEMFDGNLLPCDGGIDVILMTAHESTLCTDYETSKEIFLLLLVLMLTCLKSGGSIVCIIADMFSNFNAGIMYLLSRTFNRVGIYRPYTSAGDSSRYLICQGYESHNELLLGYVRNLFDLHIKFDGREDEDLDIIHSLPIQCTLEDDFMHFLKTVNELHSNLQLACLKKLYECKST